MAEVMQGVYTDTVTGVSTLRYVAVDAQGRLLGIGGGGGGTADSTAALQTAGNTILGEIRDSKKVTVAGAAATATLSNNLLDAAGASTDTTSYRSAQITIVTGANPLTYAIRAGIQAGFTSGVRDLYAYNPDTGLATPSATTQAANTTFTYLVDLSTANFLRIPQVANGAGATVTAAFSRQPISFIRQVEILDSTEKAFYDREAGIVATAINRFGSLAPTVSEFAIGNTKICRLHFVNYNAIQLFIQFHNSATALVSGVSVPATFEVHPSIGAGSANPGILVLSDLDWSKSGNWGVNSRVAISTTRGVYTAPNAAVLAQTSIDIETITLV